MFGLGVSEILIVLVIALIFLGPKKLPSLAKGLGKGLKNFQDALKGVEEEIKGEPNQEIAHEVVNNEHSEYHHDDHQENYGHCEDSHDHKKTSGKNS